MQFHIKKKELHWRIDERERETERHGASVNGSINGNKKKIK